MDDTTSPSGSLEGFTTDYVRRLLIERKYIYARLYNPGGSIILHSDFVDHERPVGYSSQIGNTFHLDLIELGQRLQEMVDEGLYSKKEMESLVTWADGLTSEQAADYLHARGAPSVRKLRSRAVNKLQKRLESGAESGRTGNTDTTKRR